MDHFIVEFPNSVSVKLCNEVIKRFDEDPRKYDALIRIDGKLIVDKDMKNSIELGITDLKEWKDIDTHLNKCVSDVVKKYFKHLKDEFDYDQKLHPLLDLPYLKTHDRGYCVQKQSYGAEYKWHYDGSILNRSKEFGFLSILIYLNTLDYDEGGCTRFIHGRKIRPEVGKIVIYPASWLLLHCGDKVKSKKGKYTCVGNIFPNI